MKILDHTNEHQPTYMRDVFEYLIGEGVVLYLKGCDTSIHGTLVAYNGHVLHISSGGSINYYLSAENVAAIGSSK